jgi:hypothetical protein
MDRSRGVREARLLRRVAAAQAALARETAATAGSDARDGLGRLRTLAAASQEAGDSREARLSTEAILHHHREVVKMLTPRDPGLSLNTGPTVVIGADAVDALARLKGTPEGRAALTADLAAIMDAPEPANPTTGADTPDHDLQSG